MLNPYRMGETYLVWSNEHQAWWGPGGTGYVERLDEAGRFTQRVALEICAKALPGTYSVPNELPVRLIDVQAMAAMSPGPNAIDPEGTGAT